MGILLVAWLALSFTTPHLSSQDPALPQPQSAAADVWHDPDVYEFDADGLTAPVLVQETKPNYTGAAMKAHIQGVVRLECIVELDGTIGAVRVRHSIDPVDGLVKYPRDWSVSRTGSSQQLVAVEKIDGREARACTLLSLKPVNMDLMAPLSKGALDAYEKSLREELKTTASRVEFVRVGQAAAGHQGLMLPRCLPITRPKCRPPSTGYESGHS